MPSEIVSLRATRSFTAALAELTNPRDDRDHQRSSRGNRPLPDAS
jgi:hypothetical protein